MNQWPGFRGPGGTGVIRNAHVPLSFHAETGENIRWKIALPKHGMSSPIVWGNQVFLTGADEESRQIYSLLADTGKLQWTHDVYGLEGEPGEGNLPRVLDETGYAAPTPATNGRYVAAIFATGELVCLKLTGERVWAKHLGAPVNHYGHASSLICDGELLFVQYDQQEGSKLLAFRMSTGEPVWEAARSEIAWSSPILTRHDGKLQLVLTDSKGVASYDPESGERLWRFECLSGEIASSAAYSKGFVFVANEAGERRQPTESPREQNPTEQPTRRETSNRPSGANAGAPQITGTKDPAIFLAEHWGMTAFSHKVPNGKYVAKLYFAETFSGITGPGGRVFTFNVEGQEFKDFDIWEKAGGPNKAYIESVSVEVSDGALDISFTPKSNSPAIKAIEIIPAGDQDQKDTIRIKAGQSTPFTDSSGNVWLAEQGFTGGQTSPGFFNFGGAAPGGRGGRPGGFGGLGGARSGAAYSSVLPITFEGERQYVQLTANALVGVSAKDGKVLWQYAAPANGMGINCSTPIFQDGLVFAASAYGNGGGAVKLVQDANGGVKAEEVYFSRSMQNHHGGMIVTDGALYGANGGNEGGFLVCMDFQTGDILWRDRDAPKGSLLMADGRLYLRAEGGEVILIEPSRDELKVRGRFGQPDRSSAPAWAHPIVANGKLYIRDQELLLCYDVRRESH